MNASILFWKLARAFLVPQSIHHVNKILGLIVKALKSVKFDDKKWLLNVNVSYIESLYRSNQQRLAQEETQSVIRLAKDKCPEDLSNIVSKLSKDGLVNPEEMMSLPLEVILIYEVNNLKTKLKKNARENTKQIQSEIEVVIDKIMNGAKSEDIHEVIANSMLFEVAITCLQHRIPDKAVHCFENISNPRSDINFKYRIQFAEADLIVKKLGKDELSYKKKVLNIRSKAIRNAEEALINALKDHCDPATIQSGCVTLWNLLLPLLQPNLRHQIITCLQLITKSLLKLDSMQVLLRCQAHIELAKCFQDQEKLMDALENFNIALNLDPDGYYKDTIVSQLKAINLRTNIYKQPESMEEKAGFLLEQAKTITNSKSRIQPLLIKIGELLAPSTFNWGINELFENSQNCNSIMVLREKMIKYHESKEKGKAEMDRLEAFNTRERFILWGSLAKLARKENVWEVALTASRFTLWFEDQYSYQGGQEDDSESVRISNISRASSQKSEKPNFRESHPFSSNASKQDAILLAEIHFIYAESLVYFLIQEQISLGEPLKHPSHLFETEEDLQNHMDYDEWLRYCGWISDIQNECVEHFLSGGQHGLVLHEWWIVNNACVYIWNYLRATIDNKRQQDVLSWLESGFNLLLSAKAKADYRLLCTFSEAICNGYLYRHNADQLLSGNINSENKKSSTGRKSAVSAKGGGKGKKGQDAAQTIDPAVSEDIGKAVQVIETCFQSIIGKPDVDLILRRNLVCLWVKCKQILMQPVKSLLPDDDKTDEFTRACKSIVAIEMQVLNGNQYFVFPNTLSMIDTVKMVNKSSWVTTVIELEVWTKIAMLALKQANKNLVTSCCAKIAELKADSRLQSNEHKKSSNTFLCHYSVILGESHLKFKDTGDITERITVLEYFSEAISFAQNANDYELAIKVARNYWNAILPHTRYKRERKYIKETLDKILSVLARLAPDKNVKVVGPSVSQREIFDLRAHLYGTLFLIYIDEKQWSKGLEAAEAASLSMPRPTHSMILKYRVIFKVKQEVNPNGDMAKLERTEPEDVVSDMWYRVSLVSEDNEQQLFALQQSVMMLQSEEFRVKKIESILRLTDWLYVNQYPVQDVINQVDWALDIAIGLNSSDAGKVYMPANQDTSFAFKAKSAGGISTKTGLTSVSHRTSTEEEEDDEILAKPKLLLKYVSSKMESLDVMEDIERAEMIARILVIRSQFLAFNGPAVKDTIFCALTLYKQIIKICLQNIKPSPHHQEEKTTPMEGKKGGKNATNASNTGFLRAHFNIAFPSNLSEWSTFKVTPEVIEALKEGFDRKTINRTTFPEPEVSVYYINELCNLLQMFGFVDFLLPLYVLQRLISSVVMENATLVSLIHLKAAKVCQDLQLLHGYSYNVDHAYGNKKETDLVANAVEKELLKQEVKENVSLPYGLDERSVKAKSVFNGYSTADILVEKAEYLVYSGDFKTAIMMLELAKPMVDIYPQKQRLFNGYHYSAALISAAQKDSHDTIKHLKLIHNSTHDFSTHCRVMPKILQTLLKFDPDAQLEIGESYFNHTTQKRVVDSMMRCLMADFKISSLQSTNLLSNDIEVLLKICKVYEDSTDVYHNMGFTLELSNTLMSLSKIKYELSSLENGTDFHKYMILESLGHSQKALNVLLNEIKKLERYGYKDYNYIKYTQSIVAHHCQLADIYFQLSLVTAYSKKQYRIAECLKREIDRKIELFIKEPVVLSTLEERFKRASFSSMELARHHSTNVIRLCNNYKIPNSADSYLKLGSTLSVASFDLFEDSVSLWDNEIREDTVVTRDVPCEIKSLTYTTQSIEVLVKSVQMGLLKQEHKIVKEACLRIINCLGYLAPHISVQYLALYQSVTVSQWLSKLIKQAIPTPNTSKVGSLIYQLEAAYETNNQHLYCLCLDELVKNNLCWKRILVFENHVDILKDVDDKRLFLILQHSPCKKYLFSGVMQGFKGIKASHDPAMTIHRQEVDFESLATIIRMWESYRISLHRYMIKLVALFKFQDQATNRSVMMERLGVENDFKELDGVTKKLEEEKMRLDQFYNKIITDLWNYLCPCIEVFMNIFSKHQDTESHLVLLPDLMLQDLPLEGLPISSIGNLNMLSRDFSLNAHYHRMISYTLSRLGDVAAPPPAEISKKSVRNSCAK